MAGAHSKGPLLGSPPSAPSHLGPACTHLEEGGISQAHWDGLGATRGHGCQGRRQDLGTVLRALQSKHKEEG